MGSYFKSAVLEEETVHVIKQWHAEVREKRKKQPCSHSPSPRDHSSPTWSNCRTTSPDPSSHHRSPTLVEFASRGGAEITEDHQEQVVVRDETVPDDVSTTEVQLQMPDMSKKQNLKVGRIR
ncbi:unnamed protein product [Ilex paraguariensis]